MIVRNIRNRIKLLFSAEKKLYSSLLNLTGFCPNRIELYKIALTHKSQTMRQKGRSLNNERLEFLGDAVLETVVSDIVFRHFPKKSEGFLTNLRSRIVRRESLNKVAESIGLTPYISVSNNSTSHNSYLGGNALEALIGAIYLDLGFRACQQFVVHKVLPVLGSLEQISEEEVNFKSKLVEWCQKNHIKLEYTLKQREGTDDNAPLFVSKVLLENSMAGSGTGYSKKEAHQNASKEVLALLRRKPKYVQTIMKKRDERAPEEPTAKQAETLSQACRYYPSLARELLEEAQSLDRRELTAAGIRVKYTYRAVKTQEMISGLEALPASKDNALISELLTLYRNLYIYLNEISEKNDKLGLDFCSEIKYNYIEMAVAYRDMICRLS